MRISLISEDEKPRIIPVKKTKRGTAPEIADDADMKSFRRKWAIINMILDSNKGYTLEELAEHFNVSARTIRRDIGIFDVVFGGFDTEFEKWGKRRFTLERIPIGNKIGEATSGLSRDELIAFCVAQRLMNPLKGTVFGENMRSGCDKMRSCLRKPTLERVDDYASFFYRPEFKRPANSRYGRTIDLILNALLRSRALKIRYSLGGESDEHTYTILPCTFIYSDGFIYLVAYKYNDLVDSKNDSAKPHLWKLSRIRGVKLTNILFVPPKKFNPKKYFSGILSPYAGDEQQVRVKVRFDPAVVTYVKEQNLPWTKDPVKKRDGSLEGEMEVNPDGFVSWILSFGVKAEVLSPQSMREKVSDRVRRIHEVYDSE